MSCSMCAGTVSAPGVRDLGLDAFDHFAFKIGRLELRASSRTPSACTFDKIGMVVRRSTTLVTWLSAFNNSPRSISRRMGLPGVFSMPRIGC